MINSLEFFTVRDGLFLGAEFLLGLAGAWIVSCYGSHLGLVDIPSVRSSHKVPTPKGGGIGILFAFILACILYKVSAWFFLPASCLSFFSLIGDRVHISPRIRLAVQFASAFVLLLGLGNLAVFHSLVGQASCSLPCLLFMSFLAAVFVVGTANFYNFMDGINGIAGITGIIGFGLLAGYGLSHHREPGLVMVCIGMATACAGFLPFNLPRAKVFMGDVGSILLGFLFAASVLVFSSNVEEFVLLSGFLFPFYADELVTMAERIRDRQSLSMPHRRHLYQVLANEAGIAHWKVSLGYGLFQFMAGLLFWKASIAGLAHLSASMAIVLFLFFYVNNAIKAKYLYCENQDRG